ncbi:MAG TPA: HAD-IA family hydrolase [Actinomycetota bacterium]|nr:HAD-IA family hydrolase [Actinomycetota bacterium]
MARPPLTRRFDAAVFDLYGTLVPEISRAEFEGTVRAIAAHLDLEPDAFLRGWSDTASGRQTGAYPGGLSENVRAIAAGLGADPPEGEIVAALSARRAMYARRFHPRAGALETLEELKRRDYPIGLISMCAPDTPAMWRAGPLAPLVDVEVFSSETGLRKPDAAIYLLACDRLGVSPDRVLYCGDGSYGELSGAERVGMTAIEIREPDVDRSEQLRPEAEDWRGATVPDLRDLLPLLP